MSISGISCEVLSVVNKCTCFDKYGQWNNDTVFIEANLIEQVESVFGEERKIILQYGVFGENCNEERL